MALIDPSQSQNPNYKIPTNALSQLLSSGLYNPNGAPGQQGKLTAAQAQQLQPLLQALYASEAGNEKSINSLGDFASGDAAYNSSPGVQQGYTNLTAVTDQLAKDLNLMGPDKAAANPYLNGASALNYFSNSPQYKDILGPSNFAQPVSPTISKTGNFNPWLAAAVLAPEFSYALGPALAGLGSAGSAASTAGSAAAAAAPAASGGFLSGLGSSLSSLLSSVGNIPSSLSSLLGGGTLGTIGSQGIIGAGLGGLKNALTGGNILKGAETGGLGGLATGGLTSLFNAATGPGGFSSLFSGGSSGGVPSSFPDMPGANAALGVNGAPQLADAASNLSGIGTGALASPTLSPGIGGGSSMFSSNGLGTLLGGATSLYENQQAKKDLTDSQNNALGALAPYQASGNAANSKLGNLLGTTGNPNSTGYGSLIAPFNPGDLTNDPGYKFNLAQGDQALSRKEAASGNMFSGGALKEAQTFGQGLADNTYNNAFQRYLSQNQNTYNQLSGQAGVGANAAGAAGNIFGNIGAAKAGADINTGNTINSTLSSLLSGTGAKQPYLKPDGTIGYR